MYTVNHFLASLLKVGLFIEHHVRYMPFFVVNWYEMHLHTHILWKISTTSTRPQKNTTKYDLTFLLARLKFQPTTNETNVGTLIFFGLKLRFNWCFIFWPVGAFRSGVILFTSSFLLLLSIALCESIKSSSARPPEKEHKSCTQFEVLYSFATLI